MAQRYNVSGTAYDDTGAVAQLRKVFIYQRSNGKLIRELETDINGEFSTWIAESVPLMVVIQPGSGDTGNAKIYDNIIPAPSFIEASVNNIGNPGDWGYGQGICPNPPVEMIALDGYNDPTSSNYGNYRYSVDNSIMVWIPAFWFKMGDGTNGVIKNGISLKPISAYVDDDAAAVDGYVYHRAFIDGGQRKTGFFIDKYRCSRNTILNCPSSHYGEIELVCSYNANINNARWNGKRFVDFGLSPGNTVRADQMLDVAALRDNGKFNILTNFQAVALWMIWLFQKQEAPVDTPRCRWKISQLTGYFQPRGWNTSSSQTYDNVDRQNFDLITQNMYPSDGGLAGVCYPFEMSTHNGMACGIHGISGGLLEMCIGVMTLTTSNPNVTVSGIHMFKESFKSSNLRSTNFNNGINYDNLTNGGGFPPLPSSTSWSTRVVSNGVQTFIPTTNRNSNDYKYLMAAGIPTKTESWIYSTSGVLDGQTQWGGSVYTAIVNNAFWSWGGSKNTAATTTNISVGPGCFTQDIGYLSPKSDMGMRLSLYI